MSEHARSSDQTLRDQRPGAPAPGDPEVAEAADVGPAGSGGASTGGEQVTDQEADADQQADQPADRQADLEAAAAADPRSRVELLGDLVAVETQRDEYLDDLRRSHADFENYRKRVLRESRAQRDAGQAEALEAVLDVLDDLDRTVAAASDSQDRGLARGIELVAEKLTAALAGVGLQRIDAVGVPFDPQVHEAVQQRPADEPGGEPVVVEVLRPGYRLGERTLRAAMVVVAQ